MGHDLLDRKYLLYPQLMLMFVCLPFFGSFSFYCDHRSFSLSRKLFISLTFPLSRLFIEMLDN